MKLSEHVEHIRQLIDQAFRNRLGRMGINEGQLIPIQNIPAERKRMETIREVFIAETGTVADAYEKLVEELTFTLFNRLAALKVMEAHTLHPEIVTRRESHGGRSFAHLAWLEQNPNARNEEAEGLLLFLEDQLQKLASDIPLFSPQHPYHLLPTTLELQGIINAFNQVETDTQVETEIWKSDDVLGWLYESYNNYKKAAHKASGDKTEYNKVSIQSQVYTPRWVVQFLVDNSLGKLYLEMYPHSEIRNKYKIANAPTSQTRERKPLHEIRMIDPSTGSGNYLLYGFDMYYDLYIDQIENYGADYNEADIPKLIIENNLYGVDLDDRAIQLAQLGLYIKAKRKKRTVKVEHFNIVSSDFFLPAYDEVKHLFENGAPLDEQLEKIVIDLWEDLQQAHKFGSLIRLEEKFSIKLHGLVKEEGITLFTEQNLVKYEEFRTNFFTNLQKAVAQNTAKQGQTFLNTKTQDAITFLQLLTQKYDVAVANPPYTPSSEYGDELKTFVEDNYRDKINVYENLYGCFILRCFELIENEGFISMITPQTFMFIDSFKDLRKKILTDSHIDVLVQYGFGGIFKESIDPAFYIINKLKQDAVLSKFIKLDNDFGSSKNEYFANIVNDPNLSSTNTFDLNQEKLLLIKNQPFIYWISDDFRLKFKENPLEDYFKVCQGLATGDNNRFLRFHWEIGNNSNNEWIPYAKGGTFNKWYGNLWLTVNWKDNGHQIKNFKDDKGKLRSRPQNEKYYLNEGITYSASGRGGYAFRFLPAGCIFDVGGSSVFFTKEYKNTYYALGLLNSKVIFYVADCLNPTANIQVGDIQRIPFVKPDEFNEKVVTQSTMACIRLTEYINSYRIIEPNFSNKYFRLDSTSALKEQLFNYFEDLILCKVRILINESIINKSILDVYKLSDFDLNLINQKFGFDVCEYSVESKALEFFRNQSAQLDENEINYLDNLETNEFNEYDKRNIISQFSNLFKGNSDLSEFCKQYVVNPINIWFWFKESNIIPQARSREIALEFLVDIIRTLLQQDDDGIIPLVGLPGEEALSHRLEQYCLNNGFNTAQYMQLDNILGRPVNDYLERFFFNDLCDLLNLFSYLPKTPFIWHLSSGQHQGFEAYVLIYKMNRDSLFKLKSQYISHRVQNLEYRQITLQDVNTAQAQTEKETIRLQLQEIKLFTTKIDELISEGYDPKLDDGVGKNIAPLQKKGLLRAEVLKANQLTKYLKADW
ncbi:MAG: hypothetical protein RIR12_1553 [Bacteroidota bacterium]|jgi:hypothetical protein